MRVQCKKCESTYDATSQKELLETVGRRCGNPNCSILCSGDTPVPMQTKWVELMAKSQNKPTKKERKQAAALLRKQVAQEKANAPKPEVLPADDVDVVYIEFDDAIEYHIHS